MFYLICMKGVSDAVFVKSAILAICLGVWQIEGGTVMTILTKQESAGGVAVTVKV